MKEGGNRWWCVFSAAMTFLRRALTVRHARSQGQAASVDSVCERRGWFRGRAQLHGWCGPCFILHPFSALTPVPPGTPTARLNDFLSKRLLSPSTPVAGTEPFFTTSAPTPLELPFVVEPAVENLIEQAETEFAAHVAGYDLKYLRYDRYGKDGIKAMGVSPDAW